MQRQLTEEESRTPFNYLIKSSYHSVLFIAVYTRLLQTKTTPVKTVCLDYRAFYKNDTTDGFWLLYRQLSENHALFPLK